MATLPPRSVFISDHITDPDIELGILGPALTMEPHEHALIALVWRQSVDDGFLDRFPRLRAVLRYGVGYENIDLAATRARGVIACNNPAYGVDEVADTAIAMTLAFTRGIFRYDALAASLPANWQSNTIPTLRRHSDLVFGAVGAGRIGGSALLKARALGFQTCFYDPHQARGIEKVLRARRVDRLDELLACSDVVSLHCPLSEETFGMVNPAFINTMKRGAILINTARGALVHHLDDLHEALRSDQLAAVGLDVLPQEPPPVSGLIGAWRTREPWLAGRCIINPHTGYFSQQAKMEMRRTVAENARRILLGLPAWHELKS